MEYGFDIWQNNPERGICILSRLRSFVGTIKTTMVPGTKLLLRIQQHYITAVYKRVNIEMVEEYLLIDIDNKSKITLTRVSDDRNSDAYVDMDRRNSETSVQIIDEDVEHELEGFYGSYSEELRDGFERQMFDLENAIRIRNNLTPFTWSYKAQISSRKHSEDMAKNDYFDHTNLKGQRPFDRMIKENINFILAAENIAAGTPSAIEAHEGLMNSMWTTD